NWKPLRGSQFKPRKVIMSKRRHALSHTVKLAQVLKSASGTDAGSGLHLQGCAWDEIRGMFVALSIWTRQNSCTG
ncbi:hypothetical protein SK128_025264, partial [Halocaridina rubra]